MSSTLHVLVSIGPVNASTDVSTRTTPIVLLSTGATALYTNTVTGSSSLSSIRSLPSITASSFSASGSLGTTMPGTTTVQSSISLSTVSLGSAVSSTISSNTATAQSVITQTMTMGNFRAVSGDTSINTNTNPSSSPSPSSFTQTNPSTGSVASLASMPTDTGQSMNSSSSYGIVSL